jgi:ATP-dependent Lon protease
MTGEISLSGRLLPVGGLREKLLAALRAGLSQVVVPVQNREDIESVPPEVLKQLEIIQGTEIDAVLGKVLVKKHGSD